jgi:hypothetical protein
VGLPVTAKLSRQFYERLGDDIATELVEWFNAVDATYQNQLREINELNWQRFRSDMDARFAELDVRFARVDTRLAQQEAKIVRWLFLFWAGTTIPLAALIMTVSGVFAR